jgi:hypothetical protein
MELKNPNDQNPATEELKAQEENPASVENSDVNDQNEKAPKKVSTRKPKSASADIEVETSEDQIPEIVAETTVSEVVVSLEKHAYGEEVLSDDPIPAISEIHDESISVLTSVDEGSVAAIFQIEEPFDALAEVHEVTIEEPVSEIIAQGGENTGELSELTEVNPEEDLPVAEAEAALVPEELPVTETIAEIAIAEVDEEEEEAITEAIMEHEETAEGYEKYSREKLVELLETAVQEPDINTVKSKISLIKVAFLQLSKEARHELYQQMSAATEGEVTEIEAAPDPLEDRFNTAFAIYKSKKTKFNEELEKQKLVNLTAKTKILDELKTLINSEETLKKTYDDFKVLQKSWGEIGMVPKADANGLWQNYHFLVDKFFDKVKINKELKDLDLKKNLERKMEICEKTEELLLETSLLKAFKQLQQYHEDWKETGPVPQEKRDEIWDRFRNATDKINERRREHYTHLQDEQEENFKAKVVLCEKAEQLIAKEYKSLKEWQDSTSLVNELLKDWKSVGPAPKKQNNDIWVRFKGYLDAYFAAKKDYFNILKDQQLHNYNQKLDLCVRAEALRLSSEWKNTTRELIDLQNEWKKIGPVPRKFADKIWKRFRAACDDFFKSKAEFFKNIHGQEEDNLQKKTDLIKKVQEFETGDDKQASLTTLKEMQREWMEIGHVPIKEKEKLQNEFRTAMNKHYDKMKINAAEMNTMNYRSRMETIKEQPDAGRIITKEKNSLQTRITGLQEEIKLWENNIGFFANSKQANILKSEFETKIQNAKEELATLEAKMKFLRKSMEA